MQNIIPSLWFDNNAEEAVKFYVSVFKNSSIGKIAYYNEAGPGPAGSVLTISFTLNGTEFLAINGGPHFTFSPAISFSVPCETQAEIDELWNKLSADKEAEQCGWLKDKYGMSWQIVPKILSEMLQDNDPAKATRVMKEMMRMDKLDIDTLKKAYAA